MQSPSASSKVDAIGAILFRLREILIEENSLLESGQAHDHQRFIATKNQILRDLILCQKTLPSLLDAPDIRDQFLGVRKLVDRNHALLSSHVAAMTELSGLLSDVEMQEDADGTYSRRGI